jgi:hypothetical protein
VTHDDKTTLIVAGLRLCGQRERVQRLQLKIQEIMYDFVVKKSKEGWDKRKKCALPVDTDRLPSYWAVST